MAGVPLDQYWAWVWLSSLDGQESSANGGGDLSIPGFLKRTVGEA
jgi:hypothetical protein